MHRPWIAIAALLLLPPSAHAQAAPPNLQIDGVPPITPATLERTAPYENTRSGELLDFAPEGSSVLIATRFGDVAQVHEVAGPGRDRRQLTFFGEPILNATMDPARARDGFYFLMDSGGNEAFQIYWFDRRNGRRQLLSDGKSRNESLLVSNGGGQLAFASTRRNGKDFDIYTLAKGEPSSTKLVASVAGKYAPTSWSRDDGWLLLQNFISANESRLYTLELASGKVSELNPAPGKRIAYASPVWSQAKGRAPGVYFASDEDREFLTLTYLDLGSGKKTLLTPDLPWDVSAIAVSPDGDWLAYTANEGGTDTLYLASVRGSPAWKRATKIAVPIGVIGRLGFDRAGRRLGFTMSTARLDRRRLRARPRDAQARALDRERDRRARSRALRRPAARDLSDLRRQDDSRVALQAEAAGHARAAGRDQHPRRARGPEQGRLQRADAVLRERARRRRCWCPTSAAPPATARATSCSTTASSARTPSRTSARCSIGSRNSPSSTPRASRSRAARTAATWCWPR